MKTTKEMIEVMQAFEDGKKLQIRYNKDWRDMTDKNPIWNWNLVDYRVKPESEYRPYKNTDELIEDYCNRTTVCYNKMALPQIWIKKKKYSTSFLILEYGGNVVKWIDRDNYSLNTLFKDFEYLDGSPIGKRIE